MKSFSSLEDRNIQVQGELFAYFYYHNKFFLEAAFSSPKTFHKDIQNTNKEGSELFFKNSESSAALKYYSTKPAQKTKKQNQRFKKIVKDVYYVSNLSS